MVDCKKGVDKKLVGERQCAKDGLTEIQPVYRTVDRRPAHFTNTVKIYHACMIYNDESHEARITQMSTFRLVHIETPRELQIGVTVSKRDPKQISILRSDQSKYALLSCGIKPKRKIRQNTQLHSKIYNTHNMMFKGERYRRWLAKRKETVISRGHVRSSFSFWVVSGMISNRGFSLLCVLLGIKWDISEAYM